MLYQKREKQNVVLVVRNIINNRAYFNEKKSIYVGFHKHNRKSSNIFKKATFVREFKISAVHLNQLKKDNPSFRLTYFYEYEFPHGFDEWSKNDVLEQKKQINGNFIKVDLF